MLLCLQLGSSCLIEAGLLQFDLSNTRGNISISSTYIFSKIHQKQTLFTLLNITDFCHTNKYHTLIRNNVTYINIKQYFDDIRLSGASSAY